MQLDKRFHGGLALLILTLSIPPLRAQDETEKRETSGEKTEPPDPPISVSEYVFVEGSLPYVPRSNTIVTKLRMERRATPNNVGVVTELLANEQFDRVLGEALTNVSNVNVQTQAGVTDFFYIRGFDSVSSSLVLTDGAPEPEATFYQLYNVELVEVLKGPGGFLYGSNPLAGAVNLVRKQPLPASLFGFSAHAGSYDRYEGSLDWNYGNTEDVTAFRLNALVRDEGSYREGKGGRTAAINPTLSFRLGERGRLNLNFEYLDLDYVPDAGIPVVFGSIASVDPSTNYQSALDESQQQIFRFQADYEWQLSDGVTVRDKFYQRSLDWFSNATLLSGVIPTGATSLGVIRTLATLDDRQSFIGNQLEAVFGFATGAVRHNLLAGFELTRLADRFTLDAALLSPLDVFEPVDPPGSVPFPLPDQSSSGDARSIVAAPYLIDQLRLGERWHVLLGGRLDGIDFQDDVSGAARDDVEFSPMAGVLYAFRPDVSVYGNFSRAFAPPSPRVVGELVPERSTQVEAGVKKRFEGLKTETTFAVYQIERDNIPIPDDNGFTQQTGNQRSRGFEIDVAAQPKPSLRAFFSYAYNDAELESFTESVFVSLFPPQIAVFDRAGNDPAFAPAHLMNLWVSKDFSSRWGVGGGARYVGSQFIAEDNALELDSVLTIDATAFYRIGDVRLRVNLKNLTDREYFLRGFGGNSVIPAPPFTAYFGIDYRM